MKTLHEILVCPIDKSAFEFKEEEWVCKEQHKFPVINEVPILINPNDPPIIFNGKDFGQIILDARKEDSETQKADGIDPHVQEAIGATNGIMYINLIGQLKEYPIPEIPLPKGKNQLFLDLGCNWGRWCIAAARKGYLSIGMDPNPKAILAAKRVSRQMGLANFYIVGDAKYLPFKEDLFDVVFSYSVLQHFPKPDVIQVISEVGRVLKKNGVCKIQMGNTYGLRSFYHQVKRGFQEGKLFDVRYWSPKELKNAFIRIGNVNISVDGFFSLNPQTKEAHLLKFPYNLVVKISNLLRKASKVLTPLSYFADSLYITTQKT